MKKGTHFEHLTTLIETSLSKLDNVEIKHNIKIKDIDGNYRQIDVLIEVDLGKRLGKEIIIVECKDWNSNVEVSHMGAFVDLVNSVRAIKGIYVSKKGFQKGAIVKASKNHKILIRTLSQITKNEVLNWIKTTSLTKFYFSIDPTVFTLNLKTAILLPVTDSHLHQDFQIIIKDKNLSEPLYLYCGKIAIKELNAISRELIKYHLKKNETLTTPINGIIELNREYNPNNVSIKIKNKEYPLKSINLLMGTVLNSEIPQTIFRKEYRNIDNNVEAEILTFEFEKDKINFIQTSPEEDPDIYYLKNKSTLDYLKFHFLD